jgi:hypothetical protein
LQIVASENGVVAVARGVDADDFGIGQWLRSGSVVKHRSLQKKGVKKGSREIPSEGARPRGSL